MSQIKNIAILSEPNLCRECTQGFESLFLRVKYCDSEVNLNIFTTSEPNKNPYLAHQSDLRFVPGGKKPDQVRKSELHRAFIFDAKGDTSKRWYVYYTMISPITGKRKRVRVHNGINSQPDRIKRTELLLELQRREQELLNAGIIGASRNLYPTYFSSYNISELIEKVKSDKNATQTKYASQGHRSHMDGFKKWLMAQGMHNYAPQNINRANMLAFRNSLIASGKTNRTANNYMVDISAFFNYLYNKIEHYNHKNPCATIEMLPTRSESHVVYSAKQIQEMGDWMKLHDPYLHLHCKFIAYSFLRVNEVRHIKVKDIDVIANKITRTAKNHKTGKRTYQHLQEIFRADIALLNLKQYDPEMYLFSLDNKPGFKLVNGKYFTMRFKKLKDAMGYGPMHTMYGIKHTFISLLKQNGASDEELLDITGLETLEALYKYLKNIGATVPKDLSHLYSFAF